jgi:hypothetical protein
LAALFPPWTNTAFRLVIVAIVATLLAIPTGLMVYMRTPYATEQGYPVTQPVEFDHRHHVADDGIDCRYCHASVETGPSAGIPATAVCMGCHGQVFGQSPMLEPVRRSYFSAQPLLWNRVHRLPDFVYFDHSIHVTRGIGCASCHGRVDRMAKVVQVATLQMQWCLGCHRDPTPNLRPRAEITSMTWAPPADGGALARALAHQYGTRQLTSCTTCHR